MRTSSLIAIAGLTHASLFIAAAGSSRTAERIPTIFGHAGMRSYIRRERPALRRPMRRGAASATPPHAHPTPRDIQESVR
jgi:hypothetical protein